MASTVDERRKGNGGSDGVAGWRAAPVGDCGPGGGYAGGERFVECTEGSRDRGARGESEGETYQGGRR